MTNTERIKAEIAHQLHIWSVLYNGDEAKLKREPVVIEMRKLLAFIETLPADKSGIKLDARMVKCTDGYLRAFSDRVPRKCGLHAGDMVTIEIKEKEARQ